MPRLILVATSPRVAPGLLSGDAWHALRETATRLAADPDDPLVRACVDAGVQIECVTRVHPAELARDLVDRAVVDDVLWLVSADGDPGLTDAVAIEVSSRRDAPDVEVLVGSWDVPGGRLLDVVAAMDRLRSPGGCPWDAEQTHTSLAPYLLEESHETLEAIAAGDPQHLAEELGDLLLQVVFHARIAAEAADGFDIDDVAGHLVAKLVRRHPHVFADGEASSPEQVEAAWEQIKADERAGSSSADPTRDELLYGVPASLPAALAADKVTARARRRRLALDPVAQAELDHALAELAAAQEHAQSALRRLALTAHPIPQPADEPVDG